MGEKAAAAVVEELAEVERRLVVSNPPSAGPTGCAVAMPASPTHGSGCRTPPPRLASPARAQTPCSAQARTGKTYALLPPPKLIAGSPNIRPDADQSRQSSPLSPPFRCAALAGDFDSGSQPPSNR